MPRPISYAVFCLKKKLIVKNGAAPCFGGPLRLCIGIVLEILISILLAPLRMWFHSKFVLLRSWGDRLGGERNAETVMRPAGKRRSVNTEFRWWSPSCG